MKQTSNRQPSVSYLYYFFLSGYIAAEPFFLKQIFAAYLPDFYYRGLTVPISAIVGIIGFHKLKEASGENLTRQITAITKQIYVLFLDRKFRNRILSHCQIDYRILLDLLKISHSQEPAVYIHLKKALNYFRPISIFISSLLTYVFYLFLTNFSRWGLFETSFITFFYLFSIGITAIALANLPIVMNTTKQLRNAKKSESDLEALLKILREELEDWQFKSRVVLPSYNSKVKRDIDVIAISPDNNYFVIELKSHEGKVTWNSQLKKLYQQLKNAPEPLPFKKDFLNQVNKQAKLLYNSHKLSQFPDRFLIFWRATVFISTKKRLQRGVQITEPSRIVELLVKRNNKLKAQI